MKINQVNFFIDCALITFNVLSEVLVSHFKFCLPVLYPEAVPDFGELVVEVEVDAELMLHLEALLDDDLLEI